MGSLCSSNDVQSPSSELELVIDWTHDVDIFYCGKWYQGQVRKTSQLRNTIQFNIPCKLRQQWITLILVHYATFDELQKDFGKKYSYITHYGRKVQFGEYDVHKITHKDIISSLALPHKICKIFYYHSQVINTSYLIMLNQRTIHKYDIDQQRWNKVHEIPSFIDNLSTLNFKSCTDPSSGKLYLLSTKLFCIFDLEHFKWNLIRYHPHEPKTRLHSFCVAVKKQNRKEISSKIRYKLSDGVEWYDDEEKIWKKDLIIGSFHNPMTNEEYATMKSGVDVRFRASPQNIKQDNDNILYDPDLVNILNERIFYFTHRLEAIHSINNHMCSFEIHQGKLVLSPVIMTSSPVGYRRDVKAICVTCMDRVYLFDPAQNNRVDVSYIVIGDDDKFGNECSMADGLSFDNGWLDKIKMVNIMHRFLLVFENWTRDKIYLLDLIDERKVELDVVMVADFQDMISVAFDERELDLYFVGRDGTMKVLSIFQIIPVEYTKERLIAGFMRGKMSFVVDRVPIELYGVIALYFDCKYQPSSQF